MTLASVPGTGERERGMRVHQWREWLRRSSAALLLGLSLVVAVASPAGAVEGDADDDGIEDALDNCPSTYNPDQSDQDVDGFGDACYLTDTDSDGLPDFMDNCPQNPNPDQTDQDSDGIGDACEDPVFDGDGDGVDDGFDNCPFTANSDQFDATATGLGDACDLTDTDGDNFEDPFDNCPSTYNPDQADADGDGTGDACDQTPVLTPQAKSDCKHGGWRTRTDENGRRFEDQSDCVSYAANCGRNPASG